MASTVPTQRRNAVAGLYPLRRERVRHALRVRAAVGIGRSGDASLGIARYDLAPAMPVRRMVDDPIDRQRHLLHPTVHAARLSNILHLIDSILSIFLLQPRSAFPRLSPPSLVAVPPDLP